MTECISEYTYVAWVNDVSYLHRVYSRYNDFVFSGDNINVYQMTTNNKLWAMAKRIEQ